MDNYQLQKELVGIEEGTELLAKWGAPRGGVLEGEDHARANTAVPCLYQGIHTLQSDSKATTNILFREYIPILATRKLEAWWSLWRRFYFPPPSPPSSFPPQPRTVSPALTITTTYQRPPGPTSLSSDDEYPKYASMVLTRRLRATACHVIPISVAPFVFTPWSGFSSPVRRRRGATKSGDSFPHLVPYFTSTSPWFQLSNTFP